MPVSSQNVRSKVVALTKRAKARITRRRSKKHDDDDSRGKPKLKPKEAKVWKEFNDVVYLRRLHHTMDPLIAAQVYNNTCSYLASLPEEILILILSYLKGDLLTLCCLWRVSRVFQRVIGEPKIWLYNPISALCLQRSGVEERFRELLLLDGLCKKCRAWYRALPAAVKHKMHMSRIGRPGFCKFMYFSGSSCTCRVRGNRGYYSSLLPPPGRLHHTRDAPSLGRQGAVRLCQHLKIRWSAIEEFILFWQMWRPQDWESCFEYFNIECHDPSHDTRCVPGQLPTWPRARLTAADRRDGLGPGGVTLNLYWAPYCRLDSFTRAPGGRVYASELREMFRGYREDAASVLFPAFPSNPLPEMVCFDPKTCGCLYFGVPDGACTESESESERAGPLREWLPFECWRLHSNARHANDCSSVQVEVHPPERTCDPGYLVTIYKHEIPACRMLDYMHLEPTHSWLHAMDPDTYDLGEFDAHARLFCGHKKPRCQDKFCANYYRKLTTRMCLSGPKYL